MEFNEKTALEIIERYSLSPNTLKVWKTRNSIPDKYADTNYKARKILESHMNTAHEILGNVMRLSSLNAKAVCGTAGVSYFKFCDMDKVALSEDDYKALRRVLKEIKLQAAKCNNSTIETRKLLKRSEIFLRPILSDYTNTEYERVIRFNNKKIELQRDELQRLYDKIYLFSISITL
jgi:hypothetical protein